VKIALAADHAGYELKETIKRHLLAAGVEALDFGTDGLASTDYPDFGRPAALAVARGQAEKGILFCASGQGMCMVANKVHGIRAALAWTPEIARLSRQHNDSNVLCLPAKYVQPTEAFGIVDAWLAAAFEGGRHARRVEKMTRQEEEE
jgi:ribose 5-phosphate isomerase B